MLTIREEIIGVYVLNHRGRDVAVFTEDEMIEVADLSHFHVRHIVRRRFEPNRTKILFLEDEDMGWLEDDAA